MVAAIAVEFGSASGPISARSANATARSARKRASCIFRPLDRFKLLCGEGELTTYRFNTGTAQHTFCRHCGIHAFYVPRSDPDQISVNARCLDDIDVSVLKPSRFFDGRNWEAAFAVRQASRS
jgi:hypothetical protein